MRRTGLVLLLVLGLLGLSYWLDAQTVKAGSCVYDSDCPPGEQCIGGWCTGGGGGGGGCAKNSDCNVAAGEVCDNGVCKGGGPVCGDGNCDAGETYLECPDDCGSSTVETCGAASCAGGILRCNPGCSITPRSCWEECPGGGGGPGVSCQGQDDPIAYCYANAGTVNCGTGDDCGVWACGPTGCYSDCSGCSSPPGGGGGNPPPGSCAGALPPALAQAPSYNGVEVDADNVNLEWSLSTWGYDAGQAADDNSFAVFFGSTSGNLGLACADLQLNDNQLTSADMDVDNPCVVPPLASGQTLQPGQTYYWQVVADNGCLSSNGPEWSFTVKPKGDLSVKTYEVADVNSATCAQLAGGGLPSLDGQGLQIDVASSGEGGGEIKTVALSKPSYASIDGVDVWDSNGQRRYNNAIAHELLPLLFLEVGCACGVIFVLKVGFACPQSCE